MAIFHCQFSIISRSQGKSSVGASAYRAGEKIYNERDGIEHDYTRKTGVVYNEILTPDNAPEWAKDRSKLWNEVEQIEKSKNSQLAREVNIALPKELNREQQIELLKGYVKENFTSKGMVADLAIHDKEDGNPHAHVMLTVRPFNEDGTWGAKAKKEYILDKNGEKIKQGSSFKSRKIETTDWNKLDNVEKWREQWANHANKALEKAGFDEKIDHRSLADQGIDRIAQIHVGVHANSMEKKGIESDRARINNEIKELNNKIKEINKEKVVALEEYKELKSQLENEKAKESQRYSNLKPEEKAAVEKAETIIKEALTYDNAKKALEKLNTMHEEAALKLSKVNSNAREIDQRVLTINHNLDGLKKAERELNELPKNMLGKYKDRNRAETIKHSIERYKNELISNGYRNSADIRLNERKLQDLQKEIEKLKVDIQRIDNTANAVKMGVKALQNKEIREFYKEYKDHFPQSKYYFNYDEMKAVKAVCEKMGRPVSAEEIKIGYKHYGSKIDVIDKELRSIKDDERRLINARKAIETIDKYKDIAEKWDSKVFGKDKFQREHKNEKLAFDNSKAELKDYKVRDKADLMHQERINRNNVNTEQSKLQQDRAAAASAMNVLGSALQAIGNAQRSAQHQQHDDLKLTKAFKRKDLEDELSL